MPADHSWVLAADAEGNQYFYNTETQEALWEPPAGIDVATIKPQPKWSLIHDSGGDYYYNNITGESSWDIPTDFDDEEETKQGGSDGLEANNETKTAAPFTATLVEEPAKEAEAEADAAGEGKNGEDVAAAAGGGDAAAKPTTKWIKVKDESSDSFYFYNQQTGDCQWEPPADYDGGNAEAAPKELMEKILKSKLKLAAMDSETRNKVKEAQARQKELAKHASPWIECFDPSAKAYYYYNKQTDETTWDKPADYVMMALDEMVQAVVTIQCMFRGKIARGEIKVRKQKKEKWLEVPDAATGKSYYYNQETGECQWEVPEDFQGASAEGKSQEVLAKILKAKLRMAALDSDTRNKIKAAQAAQRKAKEEGKLDGWVECYDPASDKFYYTNKQSGEVQWEKPENYVMAADDEMTMAVVKIQCLFRGKIARGEVKIKKKSAWQEAKDEATGKTYYYNSNTQEVTWSRPEELGGPLEGEEAAGSGMSDADISRVLMLKLKEARLDDATRRKLRRHMEQQQKAQEKGLVGLWVECYDPKADKYYYYNAQTQETTWDQPKEYVMAADDTMMHAVVKIQCLFRARLARRRAEAMITTGPSLNEKKHQQAMERMRKLNEEEAENKRLMEELQVKKQEELLQRRAKHKAMLEADAATLSDMALADKKAAEAAREAERRAKQEELKRQQEESEAQRKAKRRQQLASLEARKEAKRKADEKARQEAMARRTREREERAKRRQEKKEKADREWAENCAKWKKSFAYSRQKAAEQEQQYMAAEFREAKIREEEMAARERFREQRTNMKDNATQSVWDAAMHGVTVPRMRTLLNVALTEAVEAQAAEEKAKTDPSVVVDVVPEALRPLSDLSAGVGTARESKSVWHVDIANDIGETALHVAAWRGHSGAVKALLQAGANASIIDSTASKVTPLHEAVRAGHYEIVHLLLEADADVFAQDASGDTALHLACRHGARGIAALLLDYDPNKESAVMLNNKKRTPAQLCKAPGVARLMAPFMPKGITVEKTAVRRTRRRSVSRRTSTQMSSRRASRMPGMSSR